MFCSHRSDKRVKNSTFLQPALGQSVRRSSRICVAFNKIESKQLDCVRPSKAHFFLPSPRAHKWHKFIVIISCIVCRLAARVIKTFTFDVICK